VFVVRFAALAAVVVVVSGTSFALVDVIGTDGAQPLQWIVAAAGALTFVGLFVMKFVGPPPQSFVVRAALAFALTMAAACATVAPYALSTRWSYTPPITMLLWVELALGIALLTWYAREHAG